MYSKCPSCGHFHINKAGIDKYTNRQKYRCVNCGHFFYTEPHPLGKPPRKMRRIGYGSKDFVAGVICPDCGGSHCYDSLNKPTSSGKPKYKCFDCNSIFVVNPLTGKRRGRHESVTCPKCGHNHASIKGKNPADGRSNIYQCTSCSHTFNLHLGRQKSLPVLDIECPHCSHVGVTKTSKTTTAGNSMYKCQSCTRTFALDAHGNRFSRGNKPITSPLLDNVSCPHCNHSLYHRCGFDKYGTQRYKCKRCNKTFTPNPLAESILASL